MEVFNKLLASVHRPSRLTVGLAVVIAVLALLYFPLNTPDRGIHSFVGNLDHRIPVVSVFAVPYLVFLPVFWVTVLWALVTDRGFLRLALALIAVLAVSDVVYLLYQTYVPRPSHLGSGVFNDLLRHIYRGDRPYNDFPSGHASSAALLALYGLSLGRSGRVWTITLAASVVAATMVLKQHSIVGALGGVVLAILAWLSAASLTERYFKPT